MYACMHVCKYACKKVFPSHDDDGECGRQDPKKLEKMEKLDF